METLGPDITQLRRTPLTDEHVAAIRRIGTERVYDAGVNIVETGAPMDEFIYCEEGRVELVHPFTGEAMGPNTLGPTQFLGEIAFLNGGSWSLTFRASERTRCTVVPRAEMLELMSRVPEMSDIIINVYVGRRRLTYESNASAITVVGGDEDPVLRRVAGFASRNKIPMNRVELGTEAAAKVFAAANIETPRPVVIVGRDRIIENPSARGLARFFGFDMPLGDEDRFDVVIVGGGPAGIAAGVYAGAEGLSALVVEDQVIGGQAGSSSRIENYMGFPTGISGADLCLRGEIQAMRLGTRFVMPRRAAKVRRLDDQSGGYCVELDDGEQVRALSVVVATGVQYRRLPLEGLERMEGEGVYYAATDLEARFCKGSEIVIIGGGNSAGQAAMFLSRFARHVHVLVRGAALAKSMSSYLSSRLEHDPKITVHFKSECVALHGDSCLEAITVRDRSADTTRRLETRGLFIMVGAAPRTEWLGDLCRLDEKGFIVTGGFDQDNSPYATSAPGIYAVGDVRAGSVKRVASAVGEGSVVISQVWQHVDQLRRQSESEE